MSNSSKPFICALAALLAAASVTNGQQATGVTPAPAKSDATAPAGTNAIPPQASTDLPPITLVQASTAPAPHPAAPANPAATPGTAPQVPPNAGNAEVESGGVGVREFQGDDVGQVLRLLARQSKINMVVSEAVAGTVTMRLEDVTAMQAIGIIVKAKGLFMDKIDNVYYIKTAAERTAEPTESGSYQFSYARAKDVQPLIDSQLTPGAGKSQIDERTNSIFFRETRSNIDNIRNLLVQVDKPTKQVMIEARLVEVTANPKQSYGINWAGVVGGSASPQTVTYGGYNATQAQTGQNIPTNGLALGGTTNNNFFGNLSHLAQIPQSSFAILSVPQMTLTMRLLNEDADAEFLANPRVVTADNQPARIEITRNQPVPQLNFNEQTATAVFGGFEDKIFGNKLLVRPSVNKDDFITLSVKPEISNKVGDQPFTFAGATVTSPIIDTRTLESNVLIRSGDTLAIGGLLQDETSKTRNKVPIMGDIPILGYLFQEHLNARTKRNLLVFVTPTIIEQHYGTGLEDQVSGLHHAGEEFADPNGWRNNAKGAVRLVPTSNRQVVTDYPKPGIAPPPSKLRFMSTAKERDF
jgi:type IV pilus secretin PilQ/predicted competence protein